MLDNSVVRLKSKGWSSSTSGTYRTHLKTYLEFCENYDLKPVPCTTKTVELYIAFLVDVKNFAFSSIRSYLNIITVLHKSRDKPDPIASCWNVRHLLTGVKRELGISQNCKAPVTPELLLRFKSILNLECHNNIVFWAACLTGFYGFLRPNNFLVKVSFDPEINLRKVDVLPCSWGMLLTLKVTKTLQFRSKPIEVILPLLHGHQLCPYEALPRVLALPGDPLYPLFRLSDKSCLSYTVFLQCLRFMLQQLGCNPPSYGGHSFRRGAATWAGSVGLSDSDIKLLEIYIGSHVKEVKEWKIESDEYCLLRMDTDTKFENQIRRAVRDESVSDLLLMCRTRSNKTELLSFKSNGKRLVHFAAIFGSVSLIERLISLGIDVKTKTEGPFGDENVLHLACKHGKIEVVTYLLRIVSDLSFRNAVVLHGDNYRNAFYYAAESGNIEIINILKTVGRINLNEVFPNNKTVLLNLIEEDNSEAVKMLCQCGANVNIGHFEKRLLAIHFAAEKKDGGELLRLLLTHGAYVNKPWGNQQPLFIAVKHGLVKNAKVLLEAGANVHSKGTSAKMGRIGCFCLAALKCPSLIPEFLSRGADPNELHDRNGDSVLTLAIKNNASNEAISALLKAGANLDNAFQDETAKHMFPYDMITSLLDTGFSAHEIETKHKISLLILAMKGYGQTSRKAVSDLLLRGANPNIFPEGQDSPLVVAVEHGHPDIVDILIKAGAEINHIGKMGDAAIHVCCKQDTESKWQILKRLAAERTTLNMTNQHGDYPLELVMKNCSPARTNISRRGFTSCNLIFGRLRNRHREIENCVSDMLEKGANPNCTDLGKDSPLILAIKKNIENVVMSLINAGANVSHIGENGVTVLEVCINQRSNETIVQAVVERGLSGNTLHSLEQFPLDRLLDEGFSDSLVTIMIKNGANPNRVQHGEDSVLMKAIKEKRYKLCRILMEAGADVNFRNSEGMTVFDIFTGHCRQHRVTGALANRRDEQELSLEDVLKYFLESGIDVNHQSQSGVCPLMVAVWLESLDIVRLMIEKGANVNIVDEHDDTPLTVALMNGLDDIVDVLLVSKANVNHLGRNSSYQNHDNKTLEDNLHTDPILTRIIRDEKTLSGKKKEKYVKLLLEHGADSNMTNSGKTSALMYAVELRMEQIVKNLLEHDADVNYVGKDNFTALHTYFVNVEGEINIIHF
ncbi:unnamed protein product [Mytilus coruscus]|uniref:Uncharacterized protein n=1 Tax=Mytilus coruscus TaxID=42192 RepID=A0A6J8C8J2_MYTCO|nr:unnamed protein product [Mytilus coruscus]